MNLIVFATYVVIAVTGVHAAVVLKKELKKEADMKKKKEEEEAAAAAAAAAAEEEEEEEPKSPSRWSPGTWFAKRNVRLSQSIHSTTLS